MKPSNVFRDVYIRWSVRQKLREIGLLDGDYFDLITDETESASKKRLLNNTPHQPVDSSQLYTARN